MSCSRTFHTLQLVTLWKATCAGRSSPPLNFVLIFFFSTSSFFFFLKWGPFCGLGENHFEAQKGGGVGVT